MYMLVDHPPPPWPVGPEGALSPPFVRRFRRRLRRRRRRRTHLFGYYTNMVQQIELIIHTSIQPLPAIFFTQGQVHMSNVKVKDLPIFLPEVTHEYWEHLIRFLVFFQNFLETWCL